MIEVTSRHMECTDFNSDHNQMLAVALQLLCLFITTVMDNTMNQTNGHLTGRPRVDLLVFESSGHAICKKQ